MEFEWDPEKAARNLDKHGIHFTMQRRFSVIRWR